MAQKNARQNQIRDDVRLMLQALTVDGTPVPLNVIADRLGIRTQATLDALHSLEINTPAPYGPLKVDSGWVWVA